MQEKFTALTPALYDYLVAHNRPPDAVLRDLAAETAALGPISVMQISVEQGAFLTLLGRLLGARRAVEIGTFTGYSGISIARGLAADGHLLCCDVSEEWAAIARRYFARAGVAERITLRVAPAIETIRALPATPEIDLVFIDADKTGYPEYFEAALAKLSDHGLIVLDNTLRGGTVLAPDAADEASVVMAELNERLAADDRVVTVQLTVRDGLTVVRRR
jgi:predicted O-methyltransferase YrrM